MDSAKRYDRCLIERNLRAHYSKLTWNTETILIIHDVSNQYREGRQDRWEFACSPIRDTVQVSVHSPTVFQSSLLGAKAFDSESPAALVYSIHPSGIVGVIISGHQTSIDSKQQRDHRRFVIDVIASAQDLAGASGQSRIRQHFAMLHRLSLASRISAAPSPKDARFLSKLGRRSHTFESLLESRGDYQRSKRDHEVGVGAAFAAGLFSSATLPFLREAGTNAADKARRAETTCRDSNPVSMDRCLEGRDFSFNTTVSRMLSVEILGLLSAIVVIVLLLKVKKLLERH